MHCKTEDSHCQLIFLSRNDFIKNSINLLATKRFEFHIFHVDLIDLICYHLKQYTHTHRYPVFMPFDAFVVTLFRQTNSEYTVVSAEKSFNIPIAKPENIAINIKIDSNRYMVTTGFVAAAAVTVVVVRMDFMILCHYLYRHNACECQNIDYIDLHRLIIQFGKTFVDPTTPKIIAEARNKDNARHHRMSTHDGVHATTS